MAFGEIFWSFNNNSDDMWAAIAVGTEWNAVAREFEWSAGLGTSWDFHCDGAIDSFNFDFTTESGVNHADFFFR